MSKTPDKKQTEKLSLSLLDFDEVLDGLFQIKPVNNDEVTKPETKKKRTRVKVQK